MSFTMKYLKAYDYERMYKLYSKQMRKKQFIVCQ